MAPEIWIDYGGKMTLLMTSQKAVVPRQVQWRAGSHGPWVDPGAGRCSYHGQPGSPRYKIIKI